MRVMLACVVVVGATLCGKALSDAARRRAAALKTLLEDVRQLRVRMVSLFEPVADSLDRCETPLMRAMAGEMRGGSDAAGAWRKVQRGRGPGAGQAGALSPGDRRALERLFDRLGESGRESQDALLAGAAEELGRLAEAASEQARAAERLYATLGLLVGLLLALIVI